MLLGLSDNAVMDYLAAAVATTFNLEAYNASAGCTAALALIAALPACSRHRV